MKNNKKVEADILPESDDTDEIDLILDDFKTPLKKNI